MIGKLIQYIPFGEKDIGIIIAIAAIEKESIIHNELDLCMYKVYWFNEILNPDRVTDLSFSKVDGNIVPLNGNFKILS